MAPSKEIKVPIPQSMIDEAANGEVKRLTAKVARLEKRIAEMESFDRRAREFYKAMKNTRLLIAEQWELYQDYYDC